jgi:outer membrane lipoprotein carrier protein
MWHSLLLLLRLSVLPAPAAAPAPLTADQVVAKVQGYYLHAQKLRADFRQELNNVTFGKTSTADGKLYIAKPGKMRWDYEKPERKYFISDGATLWVYEEANRQAFQQSLKDQVLPVAITFLYGTGDLGAEFRAALDPGKYGGKDDYVVKLTPRQPEAQYKNLWLVVDATDFHVKESVILEATDNINHFSFANIKLNEKAKVEDRHFKFVPPPGVKVVKPQQPGQPPEPGPAKMPE